MHVIDCQILLSHVALLLSLFYFQVVRSNLHPSVSEVEPLSMGLLASLAFFEKVSSHVQQKVTNCDVSI